MAPKTLEAGASNPKDLASATGARAGRTRTRLVAFAPKADFLAPSA